MISGISTHKSSAILQQPIKENTSNYAQQKMSVKILNDAVMQQTPKCKKKKDTKC